MTDFVPNSRETQIKLYIYFFFVHKSLCGNAFLFILGRYMRVGFLSHKLTVFSNVALPFYIPASNARARLSTFSPTTVIFCLFDYSYSHEKCITFSQNHSAILRVIVE